MDRPEAEKAEETEEEKSKSIEAAKDDIFARTGDYEPQLIPVSVEIDGKLEWVLKTEEEISKEKLKMKPKMRVEKDSSLYIEDQLPGTPWTKMATVASAKVTNSLNLKPGKKKIYQKREGIVERGYEKPEQGGEPPAERHASIQVEAKQEPKTTRRQQVKQVARRYVKTTPNWDLLQAQNEQQPATKTSTFRQRQSLLLPVANQGNDTSGSKISDIRYLNLPEKAERDSNEHAPGPSAGANRNNNHSRSSSATVDERLSPEANQEETNAGSGTRAPIWRTKEQVREVTDGHEDAAGSSESNGRDRDQVEATTSNPENGQLSASSNSIAQKKVDQQAGSSDPQELGHVNKAPILTWAKVNKMKAGPTKKKKEDTV